MTQELREKDIAVLQAIQDGAHSVSEIREQTTLSNREINYSLTEKSLQEQGLVEIQKQEGREWREINGEQRYIWKPKTVTLTDKGLRKLADQDNHSTEYEDLSKRELIQQVQELEERIDRMENMFKEFRQKVMEQI